MSKTEKTEQAAPADQLGRLDAFQKQLGEMAEQLRDNAERLAAMEKRWGEIKVSAPAAEPQPLPRATIEAICASRPSARFRLLQDVSFAGWTRSRGAIVQPQTLLPNIWAALLSMQVRMADADA